MFQRVLFLTMAILAFGIIGVVVFRAAPGDIGSVAIARPAPKTTAAVLVATHPLPAGTLLRPEDMRWQDWALDAVPDGYFVESITKIDTLYGAVARRDFVAGEPLLTGQFVLPGDRGFLAAVLTPGNRAVAVAVDAVSAASGLIWPGDRVDLILTQKFGETAKPSEQAVGETLLDDIRVLAIDQHLSGAVKKDGQGAGEQNIPRTVTLEVTAKQAEKIAVATDLGRLALALRSLAVAGDGNAGADKAGKPKASENKTSEKANLTWAADVSSALARKSGPAQGPTLQILRGSQKAGQ